jgi:hypothetical protein
MNNGKIDKVSIIVSRGSLEGIYPGLIMANAARMEAIDANLFFTFFGLHAIVKKKMNHIKIATVGNPALCVPTPMGLGMPTWMGAIPRDVVDCDGDDEERNGEDRHPAGWRVHRNDSRCRRKDLRLQGHGRYVQVERGRFLPPSGQGPDRRRILRTSSRLADHFHVKEKIFVDEPARRHPRFDCYHCALICAGDVTMISGLL